MSDQKPSVGRIVHYVSYGTPGGEYTRVCRAAIITEIGDMPPGTEHINVEASPVMPNVGLAVLNPEGVFFNRNVPCSIPANRHGGTWHWPERV
jgi:hypothetical protein